MHAGTARISQGGSPLTGDCAWPRWRPLSIDRAASMLVSRNPRTGSTTSLARGCVACESADRRSTRRSDFVLADRRGRGCRPSGPKPGSSGRRELRAAAMDPRPQLRLLPRGDKRRRAGTRVVLARNDNPNLLAISDRAFERGLSDRARAGLTGGAVPCPRRRGCGHVGNRASNGS